MKIELKGRKAVVTGSTAGIGRAIAEGLARAGAAVVINGRGEERVATALQEMRALFPEAKLTGFAADLATPEGAAAFLAKAPDADILVNNVGPARPKSFFDLADSDWLDLFELNVMSGVRAARHYVPGMMERGWGRVVFISSESALAIPKEVIDYGITKTAQLAISRGLAEAVGGTGVTVNAVLPGQTNSENPVQLDEGDGGVARHHARGSRAAVLKDDAPDDAHQSVHIDRRSGEHGPEIPKAGPGQILLRTIYLSLDPYMRGRMNAGPSYAPPVEIGEVMEGRSVCEVVESNVPDYHPGDIVLASTGWQEHSLSNAEETQKLDRSIEPISYALGVLGMPGLTAYTGLLNIGKPHPGETVVVAAASGAVGSVVGQIAKIKRCRVVGIAGGEQKCGFVKDELGFDACLDHRQPDLSERLKAACPDGIDIYFENVGGAVFDAVLPLLNNFARIPVCGLIAHYNAAELPPGPDRIPLLMHAMLVKRLTFRGFIVLDYASHFPDFVTDMKAWLSEGRIKYRQDITEGLENAPRELIGLLKGENFGKKLIRVSPDPAQR